MTADSAPATGIRRAVINAHHVDELRVNSPFQTALLGLVAEGALVPCFGDPRFTANSRAVRLTAEAECVGCPAFDLCDQDATERNEHHHVWGGRDRTPVQVKARKDGAA